MKCQCGTYCYLLAIVPAIFRQKKHEKGFKAVRESLFQDIKNYIGKKQ